MKRLLQGVLLVFVAVSVANATTTLTLNPVNGALSGSPGSTVGWGFTIVDSQFWVTVAGTGFCTNFNTGTPDLFPCINPVSGGVYTDFSGFNPSFKSPPGMANTSQLTFDNANQLGTGSFMIFPNTPSGLLSGVIVVDFNLFDGDPDAGGNQIGGDFFITANASVNVVPEPGTWLLLGSALAGLGLARFRRRT